MLKNTLLFVFIIGIFFTSFGQEKSEKKYEMKNYFMVFLIKGPHRDQDSVTANEIQKAHLENIGKLAEMGKLVMAGPFLDDKDMRGIFIFDVPTEKEVRELVETDPAIKTGRLTYEVRPWMTAKGTCLN